MQKILSIILIVTLVISVFSAQISFSKDLYLCTKLELDDFSYDASEGIVSAYAKLTQYQSSVKETTEPPTSGTVVLAAYKNYKLIAVNASSYSGLTPSMAHKVNLPLDSVKNVYVKAFLFDRNDNVAPLTLSKECSDLEELINCDDVITSDDMIIQRLHTFEEDKLAQNEYVSGYVLNKYVNDNNNSISVECDENGNNYLSIKTGASSASHPFVVAGCGQVQKAVAEFDIMQSEYAKAGFYLYDSTNNTNFSCLSIGSDKVLSSNYTKVGTLAENGLTHIKMVIDNTKKQISFYVGDSTSAVTVAMVNDKLVDLRAIRIYNRLTSGYDTEVILDNIIIYSGNNLYDFSKILSGNTDTNVHVYNHNIAGLNEFFKKFTAINTASDKLCAESVTPCTKAPEYIDGKLYIAECDAAKLVGINNVSSLNLVSLEDYALNYGKYVTYTKTNTVIVGSKKAVLSDEMIKLVNSHLTYDRPSALDLIEAVSGRDIQRPYLTITKQKLAEIKEFYGSGTDTYITNWCQKIIKDSNGFLNKSVVPFVDYTGKQSDRMNVQAATILERVQKLALGYHLTGDDKYAERAWTELENTCKFPHWYQGINELDSSCLASAVAYGYDWLYDYWQKSDSNRLKIMEDAIFEKQLNRAQQCYHGVCPYGWAVTQNNWNAACNGGNVLAASAVFNADPQKCADIISNAIGCSEAALKEFYPNGAWKESTNYWAGTVQNYIEMFTTLKSLFGSSYNLENTNSFDVTANYMIATSGPTGNNNYNDSKYTASCTVSTMFWFANVFNKPDLGYARLNQLNNEKTDFNVLDLCFYNPNMEYSQGQMSLDTYFEGLEYAAFRSEWNNPNATYVSFHSGNNLGADAHSHIDSGTFVIDMMGERFACDLGSHYYFSTGHGQAPNIQPDNDGSTITRWDYYHHVPEGHNCFVINPDRTLGQNIVTNDKMESFASGKDKAFAITSLTSAYKGYARFARRGVMLSDNRKCVTVRDEIDLNDGDNEIYWYMHKSKDCTIEMIDSKSFYLTKNGKCVKVMFVTNANSVSVYESDAKHLVREAPGEQEDVTGYNKLVIKLNASKHLYLQVKFIPVDGTTNNVTINNTALNSWSVN